MAVLSGNTVSYEEYYRQWNDAAIERWENTARGSYESDVWYNYNRNKIVRDMIGNKWAGLRVLATGTSAGAAQWAENELLDGLGASEVLKTNIVGGEGVDLVCDACTLPFEDEVFDAVLCREVIEHVMDDRELLWEAKRVLKLGGWFLVTTPNAFNQIPDGKDHVRGYSPQNLIDSVEYYGFRVVERKGNLPNVMRALLPLCTAGHPTALDEFKTLAILWDKVKDSYYFGGELYLLCQKGEIK